MNQDVITDRKDEIALLDSLDMGKPVREALADLGDAISACDHFANLAEEQVGLLIRFYTAIFYQSTHFSITFRMPSNMRLSKMAPAATSPQPSCWSLLV